MDNAVPMSRRQCVSDLSGDREGLLDRQRSLLESMRERLAIEKLHDEEHRASMFADVV